MKRICLDRKAMESPKPNGRFEFFLRSFLDGPYPKGLTITDPPYNIGFPYDGYDDTLTEKDYLKMLSHIKKPCVIIHTPEASINLLPKVFGKCEKVVVWCYNSNIPNQFRLITFWGCKPDLTKGSQPYKNPKDPRVKKYIEQGKEARLYDWWYIDLVKGNSKQRRNHPCQLPEELIERIIVTTAKKGQRIIEPFAGSGTVPAVAKRLGHPYTAYEVSRKYFKDAKLRLAKVPALTICDPPFNAGHAYASSCGSGSWLTETLKKAS
jgi:hypothetical protein